jgi:hypothetical protein
MMNLSNSEKKRLTPPVLPSTKGRNMPSGFLLPILSYEVGVGNYDFDF